jgi:uncharacterized phage protein (TIGR02218 family)
MKKISRSFFNGLKGSAVKLAKCWLITLDDDAGSAFGFTEHDKTLTIDGVDYVPTNSFSSSAFSQKLDLSVNNISVVALMSEQITEEALHAGVFDRAEVKIFYVQWDQLQRGIMPLLGARFGEITFRNGDFETELRSLAQALQQPQGRTYGLECDTDLGDFRCGVDLTPYTRTSTIENLDDNGSLFYDGKLTDPDDYFQYGVVTFLSGLNKGLRMEVAGYKASNHVVVLLEPTPYQMKPGDEYKIVAGCDKTKPTCKAKFHNLINFQGFPDMPTEQEATETPNAK